MSVTSRLHRVEVVDNVTDRVVHTITCANADESDSVARGVNVNLDHGRFHTRVCGPAIA